MDALERLRQLGQVERVDQAVLDAALRELAGPIRQDARSGPARGPVTRLRSGRVTAMTAAAAGLAAVFAAVAWLGYSVPQSSTSPVASAKPSHTTSQGSPAMAAVLAAFSASSDEILMVTKVVRGEGTCCKSIIWISPARPARNGAVRTRIQTFTTNGSRLSDLALSYSTPATASARAGAECGGIFMRPKVALPPAAGIPGRLTEVNYPGHSWVNGNVKVEPATAPSSLPLRACLRSRQWRDVGRHTVAGVKLIEFAGAGGSERLWVSASTFLPVRLISITPTPYGPTTITFRFTFLPPTVANQAALAPPPIPPGFSRVAIGR